MPFSAVRRLMPRLLAAVALIGAALAAADARAAEEVKPERASWQITPGNDETLMGDPRELAQRAEQAFRRGLDLLDTDPADANSYLRAAGGMYELLTAHRAIQEAPARRNAGNAWLLAGDPGRAVVNFRRALWLAPGDRVARAGLQEARQQRGTVVGSTLRPGSLAAVRDQLAVEQRGRLLWLLLGANALLWLALAAAITRPAPVWRRLAWVGGGLVVLALAAWLWSAGARPGVVTAREVVGRQGDGTAYATAWQSPLTAGLEFSLLEERDRWWKIRLADGSEGWIPATSAQLVRDRRGRRGG